MEEIEPPQKESEALARNTDIYRALMAHSRDAVLGLDRKGTILFWNKGAEQVFGYSSAEIVGRPVSSLISRKHREGHTLALNAFLSGNCGETELIEGEALRKDGSTFPFELSFTIEQQDGTFLGLAVARNITERKNREQALRESAERYCNLFATSLEAVFSADTPDNSRASNEALEKLCGYCSQELAGMRSTNTLPPESREYLSGQIDRIMSADEPVSTIVHEVFGKDGRRILTEQYLNSINRTGEGEGFGGFGSDVSVPNMTAEQSKDYLLKLARIVSRVIESCDPYTSGHQERVAELASLVGEKMGLPAHIVERLYLEGLLHDIGKVSVPGSILAKPGELAEEEWALIRAHTKHGYSILKDADLPGPIAEVALHHHERLDGSGYPDGITGDRLSLETTILAVCDVVEAMSSHRPYRPARTTMDVLKELRDGRETKYNASVVDVILSMIESGEFSSVWDCRNSRSLAA